MIQIIDVKKLLIILLASLVGFTAFAQEDGFRLPDSLVDKLKGNRGTDDFRAEALDAVISFCINESEYDHAILYINELEILSKELNDNYLIALSDYYQGLYAFRNFELPNTLIRLNKSLKNAETLRESEKTQLLLTKIYTAKSACYYSLSLLPECYENIEKGYEIAQKYNFSKQAQSLLNNKGAVYYQLGKYDEAIKIYTKLFDVKNYVAPLLNIASTYNKLSQYESGLLFADSLIRCIAKMPEENAITKRNLINVYQIKASCFMGLCRWNEAKDCLDFSQKLLCDYQDESMMTTNLLYYAYVYYDEKEYQKALESLNKAIDLSKKTNDIEVEWYALKLKLDVLKNMKDLKGEVENMRYYISLNDTINKRLNLRKVIELEYQQEAKINEQLYVSEQKLLLQKQHFIILTSLIFVSFIFSLAFFILMNRRRKEKFMKTQLDSVNREITSKTMYQIKINKILNEAVTTLTQYVNNPKGKDNDVNSTIRKLENMIDDNSQKDFDYYFVQVNPDFYKRLLSDFPNLTSNELRLCAFIKANLNVKDIALMNGVCADSIKTARSRLRKKLGITDPNQSFVKFFSKY